MRARTFFISLFSFLLLILFPAVTIYAGDVYDFGPKGYTREKGKPVTKTDTFSAYEGYEGPGTLKVTTNALETSGKITFNGQVLLMQGDFKEQITYYEKEVTLQQDNNTIEVYDESKPGAWMQVEVTHQDSAASSAYIGSSGGILTQPGGASISIPPGALTEERLISIKTHHSAASLPAPAPLVGGVNMGPDGLVFLQPVTITVPLNTNFTPGIELPVFLYDSQKNGWAYTGIFASVNPDGVSASYNVTHFTDWILMGITEGDAAKYFGAFEAKFFDICNHTPTVELYHELQDLWTTAYFPIGHKSIWDSFPNRDYACYEVAGIRFALQTSREEPGENEGEWVNIENGYYDYTIGYESPIALMFLHSEPRQISDSVCGEQQLSYIWDIYVYLKCASPDISLEAVFDHILPGEQTGATACLMCGDEPMVNQESLFSLAGPAHIDSEEPITSLVGCADIALTGDDPGIITVSGEYHACLGQEIPPTSPVSDSSEITVEYKEASIEIIPSTITMTLADDPVPLTVNVFDKDGNLIPEGCTNEIDWTIPVCVIAFDEIEQTVRAVAVTEEGQVAISATCAGVASMTPATTYITVSPNPPKYIINPAVSTVTSGDTSALWLCDDSGNPLPNDQIGPVIWSSSNENIVDISPTGGVSCPMTAFRVGSANVTAEIDGEILTATVFVEPEKTLETAFGNVGSDYSEPIPNCGWMSSLSSNCEVPSELGYLPLTVRTRFQQLIGIIEYEWGELELV